MDFRNRHEIYNHYLPLMNEYASRCEWGDFDKLESEMKLQIAKLSAKKRMDKVKKIYK